MSRILSVDESNASGIQRFVIWQSKRQYGYLPGILKIMLPRLRVGFIAGQLYNYLHLRKTSPFTRLQREMVATVVNGVVGGAP